MTREERIKALMDAIVSVELHPINLDPYPASVGEVADEIARYVLELDASGVANGLAGMVRERIRTGMDEAGQARVEREAIRNDEHGVSGYEL